MTEHLSSNFLSELAKLCLSSKDVALLVHQHFLFSFVKVNQWKEIFKYIFDYTIANNKVPTIGILSESLPKTPEHTHILAQIRETSIADNKDAILKSFERFIKKGRFQKLILDTHELYNKQEHEKAIQILAKESQEITEFSLATKLHSRLFADFDKRQQERKQREFSTVKWPIGIPAFDYHTYGGVEPKTSLLGMARSGVGKSTLLRSIGFNIAFRGGNVVHFQAEGSKDEVQDAYDSMWTGVPMMDIKKGELTGREISKIEEARKAFLAQCGEIYVVAFEQFDTASIAQCRQILIDLQKEVNITAALFDYLDLFDPGDGKRYGTNAESERMRKGSVAKKIVNIATEFDIFTATMTQASDIPFKDWNDPNYVITRNDISNLKATVDPFAYFLTLNQTMDENDKDIIRIHEDKLRHYRIKSWEATYPIVQDREKGRFVDIAETKKRYWDDIKKVVIRNAPKEK